MKLEIKTNRFFLFSILKEEMKSILISSIFFLIINPCNAQYIGSESIEFELEDSFEGEEIYSVGENGFVLSASSSKETIRNFHEWKFHLFDTTFQQVYSKRMYIGKHLYPYYQMSNDEFSHSCYLGLNGDYLLNTFTIANFDLKTIKGTFPINGKVKNMAGSEKKAWFSYQAKSGWYLISIDWYTGEQTIIPISINDVKRKNLSIEKIQLFNSGTEILLFVKAAKNKMVSDTYVMNLTEQGELNYQLLLDQNDRENIISMHAHKLASNQFVYSGTYSEEKAKGLTDGVFFIRSNEKIVTAKSFVNYDDLEGYGDISVLNYKYGYYAAIHDLIPTDSGFILIAEMYYQRHSVDANNVPVYIGNTYTHAAICSFDSLGNLDWTKTIEIKLNSIIKVNNGVLRVLATENNQIKVSYAENNFYVLNVIDISGKTVLEPEYISIESSNSTENKVWYNANILDWYDGTYLFFSTQIKRVKVNGKKKKINVVFFSKQQ